MTHYIKRSITLAAIFLLTIPILFAQQGPGINYQAVARDNTGDVIGETEITVMLSILDNSGSSLWEETHIITTSAQGLFSIALGTDPEKVSYHAVDKLTDIEWNNGSYKLSVQVDQGNGLIELGSNTIQAVPLAYYGKDEDADPENEIQDLQLNAGSLTITKNTTATDINLSAFVSSEMAWQKDANNVLLPTGNVGVGTDAPEGVMDIVGSLPGDEPIFQVKNNQGVPVFAVYNEGVRVYIPEDLPLSKGVKGGFAVGGYNSTKQLPTDAYFLQVMPEASSIGFFTDLSDGKNDSKGIKGGFAVGGYNSTKADMPSFVYMDPYALPIIYDGGTHISLPPFAPLRETGNCYIGTMAGQNHNGHFNTSIGYQSGFSADAKIINSVPNNAAYNTNLGAFSGYANVLGDKNVYLGYQAGYNNLGEGNVFIGYQAGSKAINVSNLLYIDNEDTIDPLFLGNFESNLIRFGGNVGINIQANQEYGLIVTGGTNPEYSISVEKGITANGDYFSSSDARIKENIVPITNALSIVNKIRGVRFNFKADENPKYHLSRNIQVGVIAQEVEAVLPEIIGENEDGIKSVAYSKLTAVLIEAVKEQQKVIEANELRLSEQESEINTLKVNSSSEEMMQTMKEMQETIQKLSDKVNELENRK